jgi:hypothetical protein
MATGNTAGGVPTFEKLIRRPNTAPGPTPAPDRPPLSSSPRTNPRRHPYAIRRLKARSIARHRHNLALKFDRL